MRVSYWIRAARPLETRVRNSGQGLGTETKLQAKTGSGDFVPTLTRPRAAPGRRPPPLQPGASLENTVRMSGARPASGG
jgi:hypothetical protein